MTLPGIYLQYTLRALTYIPCMHRQRSLHSILGDSLCQHIDISNALCDYFCFFSNKVLFYVATVRRKTRGAEAVGQHMARGTFQALPGHRIPQVQNISSSSGTQSSSGTEHF